MSAVVFFCLKSMIWFSPLLSKSLSWWIPTVARWNLNLLIFPCWEKSEVSPSARLLVNNLPIHWIIYARSKWVTFSVWEHQLVFFLPMFYSDTSERHRMRERTRKKRARGIESERWGTRVRSYFWPVWVFPTHTLTLLSLLLFRLVGDFWFDLTLRLCVLLLSLGFPCGCYNSKHPQGAEARSVHSACVSVCDCSLSFKSDQTPKNETQFHGVRSVFVSIFAVVPLQCISQRCVCWCVSLVWVVLLSLEKVTLLLYITSAAGSDDCTALPCCGKCLSAIHCVSVDRICHRGFFSLWLVFSDTHMCLPSLLALMHAHSHA